MSIELRGWADANLLLLFNSALFAAQIANAIFIILSPKAYWRANKGLRKTAFIYSAIVVGFYMVLLVDLSILLGAGKSIFGDLTSMMTAYVIYFSTPGMLVSALVFGMQLASGEYFPHVHNSITD
jgi:hypothetical protein